MILNIQLRAGQIQSSKVRTVRERKNSKDTRQARRENRSNFRKQVIVEKDIPFILVFFFLFLSLTLVYAFFPLIIILFYCLSVIFHPRFFFIF